jgi:hypothetical protein
MQKLRRKDTETLGREVRGNKTNGTNLLTDIERTTARLKFASESAPIKGALEARAPPGGGSSRF